MSQGGHRGRVGIRDLAASWRSPRSIRRMRMKFERYGYPGSLIADASGRRPSVRQSRKSRACCVCIASASTTRPDTPSQRGCLGMAPIFGGCRNRGPRLNRADGGHLRSLRVGAPRGGDRRSGSIPYDLVAACDGRTEATKGDR